MLCKGVLMFIVKKIVRFFPFYMLSVCTGDNSIVSSYLEHHPKTVLSNAHQCYKEGLYDISFDLCQSYIVAERSAMVATDIPGVNARILLGFNLLKKKIKADEYQFTIAEDALLEVCCESEKTNAIDKANVVRLQDYAWRILAKLYTNQRDYQKSAICLYNSLAVQYNAYNDISPHIFPEHKPGQLHAIARFMKCNKEYRSLIEFLTAGIAGEQVWFLETLLKRSWRYDDSLDALWLLAQHSRACEDPKTDFEKVLYPFQLHVRLAKVIKKEQLDLNEVSVKLLKDHPELADSYSIMYCRENAVKRYSEYEKIKKSYLEYVTDRHTADKNKMIFLAILRGTVIGKGILSKLQPSHWEFNQYCELRESVPNISLRLFVDEAYKGQKVGVKLTETVLLYAQEMLQAKNARISSNKTSKIGEFHIPRVFKQLQDIKR